MNKSLKLKIISLILVLICVVSVCLPIGIKQYTASAISGNWSDYATEEPKYLDGYLEIDTPQKLAYFNKNQDKYLTINVKLTADIDLSKHYWNPRAKNSTDKNNWGGAIFDGQNFKIKNMIFDSDGMQENAGLFSYIYDGATIKNMVFENCKIQGRHTRAGLIAGLVSKSTIENCMVLNGYIHSAMTEQSYIEGSKNDYVFAGAIVGDISYSNIRNCEVLGIEVKAYAGLDSWAGGIAGRASSTNISLCCVEIAEAKGYERTSIIAQQGIEYTAYAGGIVGQFSTYTDHKIEKCYVTYINDSQIRAGDTTKKTAYAGGICGYLGERGEISNCFNKVSVFAYAKWSNDKTKMDFELPVDIEKGINNVDPTDGMLMLFEGTVTGNRGWECNAYGDYSNVGELPSYIIKRKSSAYAGGIAGGTNGGKINYVYNTGKVSGGGQNIILEYNIKPINWIITDIYYDYPPITLTLESSLQSFADTIVSKGNNVTSENYVYGNTTYDSDITWSDGVYSKINFYRNANIWPYPVTRSYVTIKVFSGVGTSVARPVIKLCQRTQNVLDNDFNFSWESSESYITGADDEFECVKFSGGIFEHKDTTVGGSVLTSSTIADIAEDNPTVWTIDKDVNDGDPFIRDFYWEYSVVKPGG